MGSLQTWLCIIWVKIFVHLNYKHSEVMKKHIFSNWCKVVKVTLSIFSLLNSIFKCLIRKTWVSVRHEMTKRINKYKQLSSKSKISTDESGCVLHLFQKITSSPRESHLRVFCKSVISWFQLLLQSRVKLSNN